MSIYDTIKIGALTVKPVSIVSDYVQIDISVNDLPDEQTVPQPYVEDGAIYIPVLVWETMQAET